MKKLLFAVCLLCFVGSDAQAQRAGRGLFLGLGVQNADVDELNARLTTAGYPDFAENFLAVTAGYNWFGRTLVGGIDVGGMFQPSESNADFRTNLTGAWGLLSLGWALRPSNNLMVYPMAGVGGGGAQLHIQSRVDVSFDELLADPGRTADVSNLALLFGPRLGVHYLLRRGEFNGAARGWTIGLRAGYLFSAFEGDWIELDNSDVDGGPSLTLEGLQVTLTVGGYGERSRRRR